MLAEYAGHVYFVNLAAVIDPALVLTEVAQALGIREEGDQPLDARLNTLLADKQVLLVLDNIARRSRKRSPRCERR